ncbi:MAG: 3-phosphoserine/phosphohydroxythreonine transaminase [Proteobacteria bacterium]|nr:3-phosphoserine/phosphohydroxythreonine transaminase [Pseudomonadota bacterium]
MKEKVYNFGAGPAKLPFPVIQKIREDFLDFKNMGSSVIEISHRSKEFDDLLCETDELFKEVVSLPDNYRILYVHGGAQMQFSAIPINLIGRKPARRALYYESGNFARVAATEAKKYGDIVIAGNSSDTNYDRIPEFKPADLDDEASYVYITSNNTIFGTRWHEFPETGDIPLVVDATSEILSRKMDYSKFGLIFAGAQKNLGPSGIAMVVIREDLLEYAPADTPKLLHYKLYDEKHSLANTNNTFAIYVINLVLKWLKEEGGVEKIQQINEKKAAFLYDYLDATDFYKGHAHPDHRSIMNVTFNLPSQELLDLFLKQATEVGLTALKGHRSVGGARASIYNAMPMEGIEALVSFMKEFEQKNG